jgi:hypothetical protein
MGGELDGDPIAKTHLEKTLTFFKFSRVAGFDLALGAFDQSPVGQRGETLGGQAAKVLSHEPKTFSLTQLAS